MDWSRGLEAGWLGEAWQAGRLACWQAGRLEGREGQNARATVQFELDIGWKGQRVIPPVGPLLRPVGALKVRAGTPVERIAHIDAWRPEASMKGQRVIPP